MLLHPRRDFLLSPRCFKKASPINKLVKIPSEIKTGEIISFVRQIPSNCRLLLEWISSFNSHCIIRKAMSYVEHHHVKWDVFVVYSSSRDCLDSKEFEFGYWAWKIRHHKNVEMHEIYYYYGSINIHTDMEQIKMWDNISP